MQATNRQSGQPGAAHLAGNLRKSMILAFAQVFLVILPVLVPYFQGKGLSMQQVFLLQALFGAIVVTMEIPSGYLADRLGRKGALVAGALLLGVGHSTLLFANDFAGLALFEALLGVAVSLISGADLALLYDTELALGHPGDAPQAVRNLHVAQSLSEAVAAVVCSLLVLWSLQAVVWAQVIVGWVPLMVALWLVEPPVHGAEPARALRVREVFAHLLVNGAVLRLTLLALSLWGLTTFYAVWVLQRYWELNGVSLVWFGWLWAVCNGVSGIAGRYAQAIEARLGITTVLVIIGVLPVVAYVGLAALPLAAALPLSLTFFLARGVGSVVLRDALNRRTPSRFRATANSLASFGFRGAFVLTAPLVGAMLDRSGMVPTLWLLAFGSLLIFAGVIVPLLFAVRELQRAAAPAACG